MNEIINRETGEVIEIIKKNEDGKLVITKEACDLITGAERQKKEFEKQYGAYKDALLEAMQFFNVKKIETGDFVATRRDETERISLDTKKVEAEYPQVYQECMRISTVKASASVRLRERKD